jgi:subtilase family protein
MHLPILSKRALAWTFGLLAAGVVAHAAEPSREERRLDPALKLLLRAQTAAGADKKATAPPISRQDAVEIGRHLGTPAAESSSSLLLVVRFVGDERQLAEAGFDVHSRIGSVYTGTLTSSRLGELAALPGIVFIEPSRPMRPFEGGVSEPPSSVAFPSPRTAALAVSPTSGAGALIAFIDSGVDVRHQDFRRPDGKTRIKFLLDLSDPGDLDGDGKLDGPDDFGGTLYTEDEINRILGSPGPPPTRDSTGHGTLGLSIAAGDDPELPGMAPGASLIVVKATRRDGTLEFEAVDLLNALAFVDKRAAELHLPYVVNLSLGTSYGPHDGKTAEELAIDTLVGLGIPGKAVVLAAGNSYDRGSRHFEREITAARQPRQ